MSVYCRWTRNQTFIFSIFCCCPADDALTLLRIHSRTIMFAETKLGQVFCDLVPDLCLGHYADAIFPSLICCFTTKAASEASPVLSPKQTSGNYKSGPIIRGFSETLTSGFSNNSDLSSFSFIWPFASALYVFVPAAAIISTVAVLALDFGKTKSTP